MISIQFQFVAILPPVATAIGWPAATTTATFGVQLLLERCSISTTTPSGAEQWRRLRCELLRPAPVQHIARISAVKLHEHFVDKQWKHL